MTAAIGVEAADNPAATTPSLSKRLGGYDATAAGFTKNVVEVQSATK